jgi:hypothetical protein
MAEARREFWNPEERERLPLEAVTRGPDKTKLIENSERVLQ